MAVRGNAGVVTPPRRGGIPCTGECGSVDGLGSPPRRGGRREGIMPKCEVCGGKVTPKIHPITGVIWLVCEGCRSYVELEGVAPPRKE